MITASWTDPQQITHRLEVLTHSATLPGFAVCTDGVRTLTIATNELKDVKKVPAHLSEGVFRKYEAVIEKLVANQGRKLSIPSTEDLSAKTIAARLRDAINSHITYQWPSKVDPAKLAGLRREFVIRQFIDSVEVDFRKAADPVETADATVETCGEVVLSGFDEVDLHSLARLLGRRHLRGPYRIVDAPAKAVGEVQANYDVGIVKNPDGSIIIV
jgi:hypothetical protein